MSGGVVRFVTGALLMLLLTFTVAGRMNAQGNHLRLMFYNVENLFDTEDDTLRDDDQFLPGGSMRWHYGRYERKINALYKTIIAAGEGAPPDIVALCETENKQVLRDIIYHSGMLKYNYGIIHNDSPDPRGIDVCVLYRKKIVSVMHYHYFLPDDIKQSDHPTRNVMYVKCVAMNDTLHLFVNHWPSRRGGVISGRERRQKIAEMIKDKIDSIASAEKNDPRIIITGDFNTTPDDRVFDLFTNDNGSGPLFVNLSGISDRGSGTYKYKGIWDMPDQMFVSLSLLKKRNGFYTEPGLLKIFSPGFLLQDDPLYPGKKPFPTFAGYRYSGGYSDHLPLLLDLRVR
ncbi:MAG TPA: endonuclease/exonuclease/phosphatase family protein [Bacteroidales bacterium]|nr:endonuclease/exonuclease/phosphatase family protein [Bacteroidales bacterium]